MITKNCELCGPRPIQNFHNHQGTADGLFGVCKRCGRERKKRWRAATRVLIERHRAEFDAIVETMDDDAAGR